MNDTPTKPDSPELARLKQKKALLDQQLGIAETQRKLVQELLPSSIKAPEGAITLEGDHPIESHILAYKALGALADKIVKAIQAKVTNGKIVIHSEADINDLLGLQAFSAQIDLIDRELQNEVESAKNALEPAKQIEIPETALAASAAPALAPLIVGGAIRTAADLISLFQADVSFKYKDLTIGDRALVAAVAGKLAAEGAVSKGEGSQGTVPKRTVYYPSFVPPLLLDPNSQIGSKLQNLHRRRANIDAVQKNIALLQHQLKQEIEQLTDKIAADPNSKELPTFKQSRADKQRSSDRLAVVDARLSAVSANFTAFQNALLKMDDSGLNALTRILRAEKLSAAADGAYFLLLKVTAAGGGSRTKRWLWTRPKVFYSGGAIVEFVLFAPCGKIIASGVLPEYGGFVQIKDRKDSSCRLENYL
jgi:hypothetical protein